MFTKCYMDGQEVPDPDPEYAAEIEAYNSRQEVDDDEDDDEDEDAAGRRGSMFDVKIDLGFGFGSAETPEEGEEYEGPDRMESMETVDEEQGIAI